MSGINGIFVTGTDTEVGKTHISAGLLHWLGLCGVRAAGYKPVAAGMEPNAEGVWINEDVALLQRHGVDTVIDIRESLIAFYGRRGYARTGVTKPFPYGDERFGTPLRDDLRFEVLEKDLHQGAAA